MSLQKEVVFGDDGNTLDEATAAEETEEQVVPAEEAEAEAEAEVAATPATAEKKYRIGDQWFETQEQALAYAQSQQTQHDAADAYRQGIRDALASAPASETVTSTPKKPKFDAEKFYTDPEAALSEFATQVKSETLSEFNQTQATRDADERVWRSFTDRHPDLTEFREEITALASRIPAEVQSVMRTKGEAAAYDFVATKYKAQVERQASIFKPRRELKPQASQPAGGKVETVTPKAAPKKASTFAEELRMLRRKRQ